MPRDLRATLDSGHRPAGRCAPLLGKSAARYAARGWHVFPLVPRDKRPLYEGGFHAATTDAARVAAWWRLDPESNIGLHPARSGLVVFDVDGPTSDDAAGALGLLAEPTLTAATGRRFLPASDPKHYADARHLYFSTVGLPAGLLAAFGNGRLQGVEVKGAAGYVVLPPSVHPSGHRYAWEIRTAPLPLAPRAVEAFRVAVEVVPRPVASLPAGPVSDETLDDALTCLPRLRAERADTYHEWVAVGMALHGATGGHPDALAAWREWSQQSPKFADDRDECGEKWATFGRRDGAPLGLGSLHWWAAEDRTRASLDFLTPRAA